MGSNKGKGWSDDLAIRKTKNDDSGRKSRGYDGVNLLEEKVGVLPK